MHLALWNRGGASHTLFMLPDTLLVTEQHERSAEWREPPVLSLDELGMIRDCSQSCERLFNYQCRDLVSLHVTKLFPQLLEISPDQEWRFTSLFIFLCRGGHVFQAHPRHGEPFASKLSIVRLAYEAGPVLRLFVHPLDEMKFENIIKNPLSTGNAPL